MPLQAAVRRQFFAQQIGIEQNSGDEIIKIMGNTAHDTPKHFHSLRCVGAIYIAFSKLDSCTHKL
jgi:hypothetical protein